MDKQIVIYPYYKRLHANKNGQNIDIYDMDKSQKHYARYKT